MRRSVLPLLMTLSATAAAEEGRRSEVVRVNGEVRAAVQHGPAWKKPFLYPVTRPGWSDEPLRPGRYIALADVRVRTDDGSSAGVLPAAAAVAVTSFDGDLAEVPDFGGFVSTDGLVPASSLVVREMTDAPMPYDRKSKSSYDHPHHRGIWVALDSVDGLNWWMERERIVTRSVDVRDAGGGTDVTVANDWLDADGEPRVAESTTYRFRPGGVIEVSIEITAAGERLVTFGDTKEGLLAIRVPDDFRETAGGTLRDSSGRVGEADVWGRPSDWVDYAGSSGGHEFGITLAQHPANPRRSRYHSRGYGLFAVNPFGSSAYSRGAEPADPPSLATGDVLSLRYLIRLHPRESVEDTAHSVRDWIVRGR